jgi:hypothetical protein
MVSSAAAGKTYGVAKGATLKMVKITEGCHIYTHASSSVTAINWITKNAPKGSIIVRSYGIRDRGPGIPMTYNGYSPCNIWSRERSTALTYWVPIFIH